MKIMKKLGEFFVKCLITLILLIATVGLVQELIQPNETLMGVTVILSLIILIKLVFRKNNNNIKFLLTSKVTSLPNEFIVLDLETTGLNDKRNKILEIGALKVNLSNQSITEYQSLINTKTKVPANITVITGITTEMSKTGKPIEIAVHELMDFIGDLPIGAYNSPFDMGFLLQACWKHNIKLHNRSFCILQIAKDQYPELPNHKLLTVASKLGIRNTQNHRALDDAMLALKVLLAASRA